VKHFFRDQAATCVCPPGVPVCVCGTKPRIRLITRRGVRASTEESQRNPRSRSAMLRVVEKLPVTSSHPATLT
jgi:16S rRNA (cytosine1402-N4)-methyltransferase